MITLGRRELVSIPELGLHNIWAKINTGAYSSSVDAPLPLGLIISSRLVRSSNGHSAIRPSAFLTVILGGITFKTRFTFCDRSRMKHQILIGRLALRGRFIVDVSK